MPLVIAAVASPRWAFAEDGGNDVCPAVFVEADDVRERYDEQGRLVRQLRLHDNRYVQEIAIGYRDGHAVERTESVPGHRRVARATYDGDQLVSAECRLDGVLTARALYFYDSDRRVRLEKRGPKGELLESTRFFYDASSTGRRVSPPPIKRRALQRRLPRHRPTPDLVHLHRDRAQPAGQPAAESGAGRAGRQARDFARPISARRQPGADLELPLD